jgi:hypothetical protein
VTARQPFTKDTRQLAGGAAATLFEIAFPAVSVIVDNPSSSYVYNSDLKWWIAAFTNGAVRHWAPPTSPRFAHFRSNSLPAGQAAISPAVTEPISITFTDEHLAESDGTTASPGSVVNSTIPPPQLLVDFVQPGGGGIGTGTFLVPATAVALAIWTTTDATGGTNYVRNLTGNQEILWSDITDGTTSFRGFHWVPLVPTTDTYDWKFTSGGGALFRIWAVFDVRNGPLPGELGQKTMQESLAVVLASDQWKLGQSTKGVSLPVVLATDQTSVPMKLRDGIDSAVIKGQATMAGSLPVVLASDQAALSSDVSDRPGRLLGIIASIAATVAADITDRAARLLGHVTLDSGGTLKGQATMANSVPVVLASDQTTVAADLVDRMARLVGVHSLADSTGATIAAVGTLGGDALGPGPNGLSVRGINFGYVGSGTWDRLRVGAIVAAIKAVAVTAGTPVTVYTPTAGKKFRVVGFLLGLSVAGAVILLDNAAGAEVYRAPSVAGGGASSPPLGNGKLSAVANNLLKMDVSATGTVNGFVVLVEE